MEKNNVRIEYMEMGKLKPTPDNPKLHNEKTIHESVDRFGYVSPILIDEKSGYVIAGHGRISVLKAKKNSGNDPPKNIFKNEDGEWLIPVIRGVSFKNKKEADAFLIADNRLTELGGWDDDQLLKMLNELDDFSGIGFDEKSIEIPEITDIDFNQKISFEDDVCRIIIFAPLKFLDEIKVDVDALKEKHPSIIIQVKDGI
jgi:hypothetical protein